VKVVVVVVVVEGAGGSSIDGLEANGKGGTESGVRAGSWSSLFDSGVLGTIRMPPTISVSSLSVDCTSGFDTTDCLPVCLGVLGIGVTEAEVLGCVHEVGDFGGLSFSVGLNDSLLFEFSLADILDDFGGILCQSEGS